MSSIKLKHASGNSMSIAAPATNPASDLSLKLPATVGTSNQYLKNSSTAGTLEFGSLTGTHGATDFTISDGNLVVAAGHGIDFSAQTASSATGASTTAELLDHYEEGTFTLTPTNGTCSSDFARYVKIGSLVTLIFDVSNFSNSSSSDHLQLTGIPFAILSPEESSGACHGERLDTTLLVAWIDPSNQRVGFRGGFGSSNYAYITYSMITDGTDCNIKTTMTYTTAS